MIPGPALSLTPYTQTIRERIKDIDEFLFDYEFGGIALNDPTQGFNVQQWYARVLLDHEIQVMPEGGGWISIYTAPGNISEAAFAFDTNMNVFLTYVEDDVPKFRWFDPTVENYVIVTLPDGVRSPRCCFDEKRFELLSEADTILAYIRDDTLCFRALRDRFDVEYQLTTGIPASTILVDVNMNLIFRLQFVLGYV